MRLRNRTEDIIHNEQAVRQELLSILLIIVILGDKQLILLQECRHLLADAGPQVDAQGGDEDSLDQAGVGGGGEWLPGWSGGWSGCYNIVMIFLPYKPCTVHQHVGAPPALHQGGGGEGPGDEGVEGQPGEGHGEGGVGGRKVVSVLAVTMGDSSMGSGGCGGGS